MKYDKFDYDLYKAGRKVVTRDGREVTQLTKFEGVENNHDCLCSIICGNLSLCKLNGKYINDDSDSDRDLFLLPEEKVCYFLLGNTCGRSTLEEAIRFSSGWAKHVVEYKTTDDEITLKIVHTFPSKS